MSVGYHEVHRLFKGIFKLDSVRENVTGEHIEDFRVEISIFSIYCLCPLQAG